MEPVMLHETNPTLVAIKALRDSNKISRTLTIKHSPAGYTVVDAEGITYDTFKSYAEAAAAIVSLKD